MSRLSKYKQIDPGHLAKLDAQGIKTVDDLWEQVGHKKDGVKKLAARVKLGEDDNAKVSEAEKVRLNEDKLITVLSLSEKPEPKSQTKGDRFVFWFSNYWRETAALVIAIVLLGLLVTNAVWPRGTVVVQAKEALPAYHVIGRDDVKVEKRFSVSGSFADTNDVIGRYLLKPAKPGAIILSEQLGAALPEGVTLGCRRVLTLPVRGGLISPTLASHDQVRLLFSPRGAGAQPAAAGDRMVDALVLSVNRQGDASSVVVALKNDDDLNRADLLLGTSDVFIAQVLP